MGGVKRHLLNTAQFCSVCDEPIGHEFIPNPHNDEVMCDSCLCDYQHNMEDKYIDPGEVRADD